MGHIETDNLMDDNAYKNEEISPINYLIENKKIISWCGIVVEGKKIN